MQPRPDIVEDPLAPSARARRVASWGRATHHAARSAARIADHFERSTGTVGHPGTRSHADAERRPVRIPDGRLDGAALDQLARIAPVHVDDAARRAYSLGKSWPDLMAARGDHLERACDAVVRPRAEAELERALHWCVEHDAAVVPVGGGTSVTGGIEPIGRTAGQAVVALDVSALDTCMDVDAAGGVATFQAGVRGPELERVLAGYGLTLGHVPQSFEYSTLGGWIATRSAGQQSLRYGKVESMTAALRMVTPTGLLEVGHLPAHGAGPDLRELVLGSEGTLGVITRATMRVHARPQVVRPVAVVFGSFDEARDAARRLVQLGGPRPTMVRVSDAAETAFQVGASMPRLLRGAAGRGIARAFGLGEGALVLVLCTGSASEARATERRALRQLARDGGRSVGPVPARTWYRGRFEQPYARDLLMDRGLLVDTLETSATWSTLGPLHRRMRTALQDVFGRDRCVVGSHLSHLYHDGASCYVTFLAAPEPGTALERWRAAKQAVHAVIAEAGAAASHQHGVGTMHGGLYSQVVSPLGRDALDAARARVDPGGHCNPGKLLHAPADRQVALNAVEMVHEPGARPASRMVSDT